MSAVYSPSRPLVFTAKWNNSNIHLKPDQSLSARVCRAVKAFFSAIFNWVFRTITHRIVLPAAYYPKAMKAFIQEMWSEKWFGALTSDNVKLRKNYTAIPLQLTTPMGNTISGAFYQAKAAKGQDIPTIFCFGGNGSLFKNSGGEWLMNLADECPLPFNVVVFDYPCCGESTGKIREEQLVLAADTVYQCITEHFHISKKNVHAFGLSLGGGVSAQFMASHPEAGRYINSHSFKCLKEMPRDTDMVRRFFYSHLPKCIRACLSLETSNKVAAKCIARFFGALNTVEALKKIKNPTLVIYHPDDPLIGEGNLAKVLEASRPSNIEILRLNNSCKAVPRKFYQDHHNSPLSWYIDETELSADKSALNFLLGNRIFAADTMPQRQAL
jgi:pimeloyl-ACP methyl ester carboxylesterase